MFLLNRFCSILSVVVNRISNLALSINTAFPVAAFYVCSIVSRLGMTEAAGLIVKSPYAFQLLASDMFTI